MLKLGRTTLNGIPRVAIGFKDDVSPQTINDIENYGVDVVELRIDLYKSFDPKYVISEVKKFSKFPSIATIRSQNEGGEWNKSDKEKLALYRAILPYVDAIDIELSSKQILKDVVSISHKAKKLICISYHNFDGTPTKSKLEAILKEAKGKGADMIKIATLALKREDVQVLADFTLHNQASNIITISMGAEGVSSRVFFPGLGSLITYASLGSATAPGQLDYTITIDLLRRMYPRYNQEKINSLKLLELA